MCHLGVTRIGMSSQECVITEFIERYDGYLDLEED
jgi:hypothetical protein